MSDAKPPVESRSNLKNYQKETAQHLSPAQFIAQERAMSDIGLRERMVGALLRIYAGLIAATIIIFILQGFKLWGFNLPENLLHWLGGAALGEVGGLAALVYGSLFRRP